VYATNGGTQTRSAACTNAADNTAGLTCATWSACSTSGVAKTVTCNSGYKAQNQGTASASCISTIISSGTSPTGCTAYTETKNVNENTVSGCSGGSAGGETVSSFVVGGYCSSTLGSGSYSSPAVQACSNCSPATSAAGRYCYCKIHSINGTAVASSSRFVHTNRHGSAAADCKSGCAGYCAYYAQGFTAFRTALFSALGS
jgi:hypothetical protein